MQMSTVNKDGGRNNELLKSISVIGTKEWAHRYVLLAELALCRLYLHSTPELTYVWAVIEAKQKTWA